MENIIALAQPLFIKRICFPGSQCGSDAHSLCVHIFWAAHGCPQSNVCKPMWIWVDDEM